MTASHGSRYAAPVPDPSRTGSAAATRGRGHIVDALVVTETRWSTWPSKRESCSGRRTRTSDHRLNRALLYQLSYAGPEDQF